MKQIIVLAFIAAFATRAAAQPRSSRPASPEEKTARKAKATAATAQPKKKPVYFDFTGDEIDGDRVRPDGTTIFGLRTARHGSLIELRGDFLREIVKSAESL